MLQVLFVLLAPILIFLLALLLSFVFFMFYYKKKGMSIKRKEEKFKTRSILKRVILDFPNQLSKDIYSRDPNEFREFGLHMIVGEQGSGKTTTAIHLLQQMKMKYPKCKIRTNMGFLEEDGAITHWKDLVKNENGIYGQIEMLDEIQTWFNSNQSKDFPVEMLTEISQQRKQRKMLIGTAQVFNRISKPLREQTSFVYCPITILGCLTIVRVSKPRFYSEEKQVFTRFIKTYFFVHNDKLRDAFDTYRKIESYVKEGFKKDEVTKAS